MPRYSASVLFKVIRFITVEADNVDQAREQIADGDFLPAYCTEVDDSFEEIVEIDLSDDQEEEE